MGTASHRGDGLQRKFTFCVAVAMTFKTVLPKNRQNIFLEVDFLLITEYRQKQEDETIQGRKQQITRNDLD